MVDRTEQSILPATRLRLMGPDRIHPRMERLREPLGRSLNLDDPAELDAVLEDIEVLFMRCGYHLRFDRSENAERRARMAAARRVVRDPPYYVGGGRLLGSANWAARQLGLGLATIWAENTGTNPTRRVGRSGQKGEHGPYRDFVALIMGVLPQPLRATRKGHAPRIDYIVRLSIAEFKSAQLSRDESRRRGLLDERHWLRIDVATMTR